jgi:Tfp pilus assembly protein FimT
VELAIVVAIVGAIAAMAAPRYAAARAAYRADAAAQRTAAELNAAGRLARATSSVVSVAFDQDAATITIAVAGAESGDGQAVVHLAEAPYNAAIDAVSLGGPAAIRYDGHGRPDVAGYILLGAGGAVRRVVIDPQTGGAAVVR